VIGYVLKRTLGAIAVLIIVSIVVFALLHLAPGDPASVLAGPDAGQDTVAAIRHQLGLDQPLIPQYFHWLGNIVTGHLGMSYTIHQPVSTLIGQRIGSTLQLTVAAALLMVVFGTLMGVALATSKHAVVRRAVDYLGVLALALPPFVSGVLLIFIFAVVWKVLPSGGSASLFGAPVEAFEKLVLPSIAMSLPGAPVIARLLATEMRRVEQQEFVLTAMAKGASARWIRWRHVVPNSLAPAIIEVGIRIGQLLGGAIIAEAIFARPGLGSLLVQSVQLRDYQLAQVLLLLAVSAAIVMQLLAELLIAGIDPRVRLGART
jgi:peptide/nickel transport system permease protein